MNVGFRRRKHMSQLLCDSDVRILTGKKARAARIQMAQRSLSAAEAVVTFPTNKMDNVHRTRGSASAWMRRG